MMMDEGTIRMQAQMFALVAEMEAIKARIEGQGGDREAAISQVPAQCDCSTCRFFYRKTERTLRAWIDEYGDEQGKTTETETRVCRRYPHHVEHYPEDWCGEYIPSNDSSATSRKTTGNDACEERA